MICLLDHRPHETHGGGTFERACPKLPRHLFVQRQRLRRRRDHRHADADIRLLAQAKRAQRQDLPVGLTENLEAGVRQGVEHDADLHADRLVLHQRGEMLGFGAGQCAALAAQLFRQIVAADQAVAQKALHLGSGDQVDDRGPAPAIGFLALVQHRHQLVDLGERPLAGLHRFGHRLAQDVAERAIEGVGGEHIGDRSGQHDDVLGGFLDLPHALEITHRGSDVFDADAEQGRHRDLKQLGELLQGLDLGHLALLEAVERSARNAELLRDLLRGQSGAEAERFEPMADIVEADGHHGPRIRFAASSAAVTIF